MRELHYEAGLGIRPPRRGGKVRGVIRELEPGGGIEIWHCDHDHAPGIRSCLNLTAAQADDAMACAESWVLEQIIRGNLAQLPVVRDESYGR